MPQRKQNFIEGAAVLTLAVAVTKVIGAVYKIPLGNLLDKDGMAHFYVAYNIYSLLLIVSTAGLPLAMSRLVSQAEAVGRVNQRRRIFRVTAGLFLLLGLACCGGEDAARRRTEKIGKAVRALPILVPVAGLEPARCRQRWILSPLRLPIPSHRHMHTMLTHYTTFPARTQEEICRRAGVSPAYFLRLALRWHPRGGPGRAAVPPGGQFDGHSVASGTAKQ